MRKRKTKGKKFAPTTFIYHFHANAFQLQKIKRRTIYILLAFPIEASGLSWRFSFQFLLHFPRRATLFFLKRDEIVQWPRSQPYRQERGVFDMTVVFAENEKSPPLAAILFSFATFYYFRVTLREVLTSRKLPGRLPGKLTGSKITGVSRNTRKVYEDLPGPIIYRVILRQSHVLCAAFFCSQVYKTTWNVFKCHYDQILDTHFVTFSNTKGLS